MEHYTCPRELIPVVEAALAAEGFVVEAPLAYAASGARITVMARGATLIALHEDDARDTAEIILYRNGEAARLHILDELPRLAAPAIGAPRRGAWARSGG